MSGGGKVTWIQPEKTGKGKRTKPVRRNKNHLTKKGEVERKNDPGIHQSTLPFGKKKSTSRTALRRDDGGFKRGGS